jgi:hypothetical protein
MEDSFVLIVLLFRRARNRRIGRKLDRARTRDVPAFGFCLC